MVFKYHRSVLILYSRTLIVDTEKVIKAQPCRVYHQKTGGCSWLIKQTRSKIRFFCTYTGKPQKNNVIAATLILGRKTDVEYTLQKG